jgi:hypothetical protein
MTERPSRLRHEMVRFFFSGEGLASIIENWDMVAAWKKTN